MEKCCCVFRLETGVAVIAIIGLIFGGIEFITGCALGVVGLPLVLVSLLRIVSCCLLLWGTLEKKHVPILAYLIIQAPIMIISIVIFVLWCTGSIAVLTLDLPTDWTIVILVILLVSAIILGYFIYLWAVVYNFYRQLKEGGSPSAPPIYKV